MTEIAPFHVMALLARAKALAARMDFDAAVVLEIGLAGDIPGVPFRDMPLRLGDGPVPCRRRAARSRA